MKRLVLAITLLAVLGTPAWAGSNECKDAFALRDRDYDRALSECQRMARQGNAGAQVILGMLYEEGRGGYLPNYGKAAKWYRQAAEHGIPEAQWSLARLYVLGRGVLQDYAEAIKWYERAAEKDYDFAQWDLGKMYRDGKGVPQNYVLAHMWLNLTAAKGWRVAAEERDDLVKLMTAAQIAEAQRLAREWKPTK